MSLPAREPLAIQAAIEKLEAHGNHLEHPHSSATRGIGETLRELRPRAGRSPWRAFYRRIGDVLVIATIGPEASVNPAGFRRAVNDALSRLSKFAEDSRND